MFGNTLKVSDGIQTLILRAPIKTDIPYMANGMADWEVKKYLGGLGAPTEEGEIRSIEETEIDRDGIVWVIQPENLDHAIGSTSLHGITDRSNGSYSGFVIWEKEWWRRGIASLSHIARAWFAARQLNRFAIHSSVFSPNTGSYKALEKVGYIRTGISPRNKVIDGVYIDTYHYTWLNPERIQILYPEGVPQEYEIQIEKARECLRKGDEYVKYI